MAVLTNFLKLLKPEKNDYVDVDKHISENYDKIDSKMQELDKKASKTQLGRVVVGDNLDVDEEGKITHPTQAGYKHIPAGGAVGQVLKNNGNGSAEWGTLDIKDKLDRGNLPATIPDGKTIYDLLENNGGINIDTALLYLNDAGTKTQGKVYFDRNKKGLFECIQTTTSTTNSTTYFVDISNKASSDRLANLQEEVVVLSTLETHLDDVYNIDFSNFKKYKYINAYSGMQEPSALIGKCLISKILTAEGRTPAMIQLSAKGDCLVLGFTSSTAGVMYKDVNADDSFKYLRLTASYI